MNSAPENNNDVSLIARIADGDSGAVGELYDRLGGWIYSLAFSVVRDKSDAEEVTQELFLSVWEKARRYSTERGSVRAWLATMTRRLAIDRTRARGFKEKQRRDPAYSEAADQIDQQAEGDIVNRTEGRVVMDAMKRLEDSQREVIYLSYYEGYSHGEIARKLSMPLGTVKTRIRSGMNQLRQLLDIKV